MVVETECVFECVTEKISHYMNCTHAAYKAILKHMQLQHKSIDIPEVTSVLWATLGEQFSDNLTGIESSVRIGVLDQRCQQCYHQYLQVHTMNNAIIIHQ